MYHHSAYYSAGYSWAGCSSSFFSSFSSAGGSYYYTGTGSYYSWAWAGISSSFYSSLLSGTGGSSMGTTSIGGSSFWPFFIGAGGCYTGAAFLFALCFTVTPFVVKHSISSPLSIDSETYTHLWARAP